MQFAKPNDFDTSLFKPNGAANSIAYRLLLDKKISQQIFPNMNESDTRAYCRVYGK